MCTRSKIRKTLRALARELAHEEAYKRRDYKHMAGKHKALQRALLRLGRRW